jgi:hypothetical protein
MCEEKNVMWLVKLENLGGLNFCFVVILSKFAVEMCK